MNSEWKVTHVQSIEKIITICITTHLSTLLGIIQLTARILNYIFLEAIEDEILLNWETESNQYNYCEEMSERMTFYSKSQGTSSKKNCTENGKLTLEWNSNDVESPPIKIQEFNENYWESDWKEFNIPNEIESSWRDFEVSWESEFKASPFSEKSVISMNTKDSKYNIYWQDRSKGQVVSPSYWFNNKIQQIKRINTQNEFQTVDGSTNIKTIKYSDNNFTSRKDPSWIVHGILTGNVLNSFK